jgi:Flp pilus assembly protein TadG
MTISSIEEGVPALMDRRAMRHRLSLRGFYGRFGSLLGRAHKAHGSANEGGALIEFAMVLPFMMILITGMSAFGLMLNNYLSLTNAVDIGARYLALLPGQSTDPCSDTAKAVYSAAPFLIQSNMTFTFVINGNTYTKTTCAAGAANLVAGQNASVTVTYPFTITMFGWKPSSLNLIASTTELMQ